MAAEVGWRMIIILYLITCSGSKLAPILPVFFYEINIHQKDILREIESSFIAVKKKNKKKERFIPT